MTWTALMPSKLFSRLALCCWTAALAMLVTNARAADARSEAELLAVLRSDAPPAERAMVCKLLAVQGSPAAVPELAKLLPDAELASWARIALEAIPGEESNRALRDAAESLEGILQVGVINSIGVRGDSGATDLLAARLADDDAQVAAAAAVALGHVGGDQATAVLTTALADSRSRVRSAAAEGCILCAERSWRSGDAGAATRLYDQVRSADVPAADVLSATRGAILARGESGVPLLLEQLRSPNRNRFRLALGVAREFPGAAVDGALAKEIAATTPDRAALILGAMADRPATVVLSAVLAAAAEGEPPVRLAAVRALARVGDETCLPTLATIAVASDDALAEEAKTTLAALPGAEIDTQIAAQLGDAEGETYAVLLELVGRRRIDAVEQVVKALDHDDAAVRAAALGALGETVDLDSLGVLIGQVVAPREGDAAAARAALLAASVRMPDREACAAAVAAALGEANDADTKTALLETLGAVGGAKALAAVGRTTRGESETLQDVGTRLLGQWMTADAAPVLLDLAKTLENDRYRARSLRGYLRIARQFDIPEDERMTICREALAVARSADEKRLVLEVLERHPSSAALRLAVRLTNDSELRDEAARVARAIAEQLDVDREEVRRLLSEI